MRGLLHCPLTSINDLNFFYFFFLIPCFVNNLCDAEGLAGKNMPGAFISFAYHFKYIYMAF